MRTMQFLYPTMLLGALGVSAPIVIHLLNRYRFKQVEWGAMELLRRALIVRSSRLRLEDLILLLLRCLIILLIALSLARPVLTPSSGSWLGRSADVGVVIAVDASFSMDHRPGLQSRFDRAKEKVQQVARTLKPGSPMTLVLLGDRPRVLIHKDGYDPDRLENVLKEAAPFPERLNVEAGLEDVKNLVAAHNTPIRECYLISDAQAASWEKISDRSRSLLQDLSATGPVFFLPATVEGSENLAVTRFELKSGLLRKGAVARYDIEVSNLGNRGQKNVTVSLMLNDVSVDQRVLDDLAPGQKVGVSMFVRFDKIGLTRLTAKIGPDELTEDNARYLVADIRDKTRILYVKAASLENTKKDDKDYIVTALTPRPSEALSVETVSLLELPTRKLSDYQIVILANVPDLVRDQFERLYYFVEEGGGLIVFLGDNVLPELYNASFKLKDESLLPAKIGEAQADSLGWPIEAESHPLSRVLAGAPSEMLRDARVQRYFRLKLDKGGRGAVKLAEREEPIVAEKTLGRGRVILFAAAADRDWTNMVVESPLYPMLLHEAVTFLGRQTHEKPINVSGKLSLPLPVRADDIKKILFQPKGGRSLPPVEPVASGSLSLAQLDVADLPGFYEVTTDPPGIALLAAVNVDARESRLQPLAGEGLRQAFQGLDVNLMLEGDAVEAVVKDSRLGRDLWRELLIAAVLVLLVEGFLARWFTHRAGATTSREMQAA